MRKAFLIAMCLSLASFEAQAISRYETASMSCGEVKATLRGEGAAILRWRSRTSPGLVRYGRFVANRSFCESGTRAETVYVPTADRRSCPVLECHYYDPDDDVLFRFGHRN